MKKQKPIAVFDIDGTIFRSSLLIELNEKLVRKKIFLERARSKVMKVRTAWLNRQGSYTDYIDTIIQLYINDIKGKRVRDIRAVSTEMIAEQKNRVYVYTRDLIRRLRKTHTLVVISFSPTEVVEEFNKHYKFQFVSGLNYEYENGVYTGELTPGTEIDKTVILSKLVDRYELNLTKSIGVGDTETDAGFLKMVDRPIAFNPNKKLYVMAKRKNWEVVVERKNVIYKVG